MCIVENDELLRDSMVLFFRAKGVDARAFGNTEEASAALDAWPSDIVICNQELPVMDGLKFLEGVGARHPAVVKILILGQFTSLPAGDAKRAGIDEVLLKPFSVDEIERMLERRAGPCIGAGRSTGGAGGYSEEKSA